MNTYDKGIWAKLARETASDENPDKYSIEPDLHGIPYSV